MIEDGKNERQNGVAGSDTAIPEQLIPNAETLCLEIPLYQSIRPTDSLLKRLRAGPLQFDAYCIYCEKESTFRAPPPKVRHASFSWCNDPGQFSVKVYCTRHVKHCYIFAFDLGEELLTKYGQIPSLEDIAGADVRKYQRLMPKGYFSELKRATGLASHGIGIGSFVYLRRIFEKLIFQHHDELVNEGREIKDFASLRMDEKIAALKDVLPPALVENKATYGILSSGIHELNEDACRRYFPVVRQAIITILDQDLRLREQEEESQKLRAEIARIAGEVGQPDREN